MRRLWQRLLASLTDAPITPPRFKEHDRVFLIGPDWDPDAGWEQPIATVVAPGRYTLVRLDPEFREFQDEMLVEVPEEHLHPVEVKDLSVPEGTMMRRQAE